MRFLLSRFAVCALLFGVYFTQVNQSQAGLLAVSNPVTPNSSGTGSVYSYNMSLTSNGTLQSGDYFTIYDFRGLIPNTNTQPTGFAFSSALVGPTPAGTNPVDSPTISNLTWTYTASSAPVGPVNLGTFTVQSQSNMPTTGSFTSLSQTLVGDRTTTSVSQSQVTTPSGSSCGSNGVVSSLGDPSGAPVVPEPPSLALCAGLPLIGLYWLRRQRSLGRRAIAMKSLT
jgi:hypothetical protein